MIAAIVQARMGSTRLPEKTMKNILGKPMLAHLIERLKRAQLIDEIIIATTAEERDKPIMTLARQYGVKCFAGSEEDVLDRYFQAATKYRAEIIVRITSDCPLMDPKVVNKVIETFLSGTYDYVSNTINTTYPDGLDVEVFSYQALKKAWSEAKKPSEREHVTSYIWNHPEIFRIVNVSHEKNFSYMRWSVDTENDLKFVREIYERLYKEDSIFYMQDILRLLEKYPALLEINKDLKRNEGYLKSLKENAKFVDR